MSVKKKQKRIIQLGFELLMEREETGYDQITIKRKLHYLGIKLSTGFLSTLYTTGKASDAYRKKVADGFCEIIRQELCLEYVEASESFAAIRENCQKSKVPEFGANEETAIADHPGLTYHAKGRLFISEKATFIKSAKQEIFEVGVRLRRFSEYFTTRSEAEFKTHVEELLAKGVQFKSYLLDPNSNAAHFYFSDRAKVLEKEKDSIPIIKDVIKDLKAIGGEMEEKAYPGKFELYTYASLPTNAFMAIDPYSTNGKMIVQHYIYGVKRNLCPTVELTREGNPKLFARYLSSLESIIKDAKKVV